MTPQELAALPLGSRIKFDLSVGASDEEEEVHPGYNYGVISRCGATIQIDWDRSPEEMDIMPSGTIIYTNSPTWAPFIVDISLDTTGSV